MTRRVRFHPQAREDLIEQADYLAESASLQLAERFLDAAQRTLEKLADTPRIGRIWEGYADELRSIRVWKVEGFPKILIFYEPEDPGVRVIRILHGARDLPPLLRDFL